jgi:hypothetical protein
MSAGDYRMSCYDADGRRISTGETAVARGRHLILRGRKLDQGEMEFITIE